MRERLYRLGLGLSRVVEGGAALLLFAIVVFNFLQVIFRYVVNSPLGWTEELMRYSIVWVTYLASVAALFRGEHMAVDALITIVPPRLAALLRRVVLACIGLFCLILVWEGFPMASQDAAQFSPSAEIPMIWPHISVPVGGALMLVVVGILLVLRPEWVAMKLKGEGAE